MGQRRNHTEKNTLLILLLLSLSQIFSLCSCLKLTVLALLPLCQSSRRLLCLPCGDMSDSDNYLCASRHVHWSLCLPHNLVLWSLSQTLHHSNGGPTFWPHPHHQGPLGLADSANTSCIFRPAVIHDTHYITSNHPQHRQQHKLSEDRICWVESWD